MQYKIPAVLTGILSPYVDKRRLTFEFSDKCVDQNHSFVVVFFSLVVQNQAEFLACLDLDAIFYNQLGIFLDSN